MSSPTTWSAILGGSYWWLQLFAFTGDWPVWYPEEYFYIHPWVSNHLTLQHGMLVPNAKALSTKYTATRIQNGFYKRQGWHGSTVHAMYPSQWY